jgi:orotate phosphoribosyltransferase
MEELRRQATATLQEFEVLMLDGHFDYGNGYHGRAYVNPHRIFRQPSLIWRLAQDLLDVIPDSTLSATQVVAGPVMGGALLAHTMAGLLDGRRDLRHPPTSFAVFEYPGGFALTVPPTPSLEGTPTPRSAPAGSLTSARSQDEPWLRLRPSYRTVVAGQRVLLADDVRNTGKTLEHAKRLVEDAGGTVIGSAVICDRLEAIVDLGVPNVALVEYPAPENYPAADCPMCRAGEPITAF